MALSEELFGEAGQEENKEPAPPEGGPESPAPAKEGEGEGSPKEEGGTGEKAAGSSASESSAGKEPTVETSKQVSTDETASKGKDFEIVKLRADRRRYREELEKAQSRIRELEAGTSKPQPSQEEQGVEEILKSGPKDEDARVRDLVRREIREKELVEESDAALMLILSQDGITKQDLKDIAFIMKDEGLDTFAKSRPISAAKAALSLWKEQRNGTKANGKVKAEATGIPVSAGGSQGKRTFTRDEISKMTDEEYAANREAILTAQDEGRIQ